MADFSKQILNALSEIGDGESARKQARAVQVRNEYVQVMKAVYGDGAQIFLEHTNAVFIMMKNDQKTLIVYVDESIYSAELNAQRELIRMRFLDMFHEQLEAFEIYVSRGKYKKNHPFIDAATDFPADHFAPSIPLDEAEKKHVQDCVQTIENPRLAQALKKAMTADLEWKKGISEGNDEK